MSLSALPPCLLSLVGEGLHGVDLLAASAACLDLAAALRPRRQTLLAVAGRPFFLTNPLSRRRVALLFEAVQERHFATVAAAVRVGAFPWVRSVFFWKGRVEVEDLLSLGSLPALELLDVMYTRLLSVEASFPRLSTLQVRRTTDGDALLASLAAASERGFFPRLTKLVLADNRVTEAGVVALTGTALYQRLRTLDLEGNAFGEAGVDALASLPARHLSNLRLAGNGGGGVSLAFNMLLHFPRLSHLTHSAPCMLLVSACIHHGVSLDAGQPRYQ